MAFARPKLILLLVIPVTLIFWEWVRRGQPLVLPFNVLHKRRGWFVGGVVLVANSLPAALLALAILFLAASLDVRSAQIGASTVEHPDRARYLGEHADPLRTADRRKAVRAVRRRHGLR